MSNAETFPEAPITRLVRHRRGDVVEVACPLCRRTHTHGAMLGHRVAHCPGTNPLDGYVITDPRHLLDAEGGR